MLTLHEAEDRLSAPSSQNAAGDRDGQAMLPVVIRRTRRLTPRIVAFELVAEGTAALPGFAPGAHIGVDLRIGDATARRSYSLVNAAGDGHYEIAVLREDGGAGGSLRMHAMKAGDRLVITPPQNAFPLSPAAPSTVLIAGGIGITPILAMARELARRGDPYALHYATRTPEDMAYREEAAMLGRASLYFDGGEHRNGLPLEHLLARPDGRHVYVCGPAPLIKAVIDGCARHGWPEAAVHYELFTGSLSRDGDRTFELEMRTSGIVVNVPATMSILDVAIGQGIFTPFECRRGECGMCATPVIDGKIDHRDHFLTEQERAAGDTMCICVSRAAGARLVLDL